MQRTLPCLVLLSLPLLAGDVDDARRKYPPEVTRAVLTGQIPAPDGFDEAIAEELGADRLKELRSGDAMVEGRENDLAALVLLELKAPEMKAGPGGRGPQGTSEAVTVRRVDSDYPAASGKTSGFFRTGQPADLMLSGLGFNETGGPLLFNHPAGIATDGTRLFLADTYNNRVLVWSKLPEGNVEPDLVLGQKDFRTNAPGSGRDGLNFPINVASDGKRILVADTENNRILIWNECPKENGAPADLVLGGDAPQGGLRKDRIQWPWGVWSDGTKVAVSNTRGGSVLVWSSFPTEDDQPADLVLTGGGKLGTPRTITSDGKRLIVGDHNARVGETQHGSFVWATFPTEDDQPYDWFMTDPRDPRGAWLRGTFTPEGKLLLLGADLHVWDSFPEGERTPPDLSLHGFNFHSGDHTGIAVAGGRVYVCTGNLNMVAVYKQMPTGANAVPDFAIGSTDLSTNTLETHFVISNPVPASNGTSLFACSDFDRKLYVWKRLPDRSGAHPDLVYTLAGGGLAIALHGDRLATAGRELVYVWDKLPLEGNLPDRTFRGSIGKVKLQEVKGVAMDDRYFYVGDFAAKRIYVWEGVPDGKTDPVAELEVENPWRVMSDGTWLVAGTGDRQKVVVWEVASIAKGAKPRTISGPGGPRGGRFNWVQTAFAAKGHLFIVECGSHRVHAWRRIEDAMEGAAADAILGQEDAESISPAIGANRLFTPASAWFDGSYLWVGETKFSERLLRFSPLPE